MICEFHFFFLQMIQHGSIVLFAYIQGQFSKSMSMAVGGSQSNQQEPTQLQEEHANLVQKCPWPSGGPIVNVIIIIIIEQQYFIDR